MPQCNLEEYVQSCKDGFGGYMTRVIEGFTKSHRPQALQSLPSFNIIQQRRY